MPRRADRPADQRCEAQHHPRPSLARLSCHRRQGKPAIGIGRLRHLAWRSEIGTGYLFHACSRYRRSPFPMGWRRSCQSITTTTTPRAFERTSKRRKGLPSGVADGQRPNRVKRGQRTIKGGQIELLEKLGPFRRLGAAGLLAVNKSPEMVGEAAYCALICPFQSRSISRDV